MRAGAMVFLAVVGVASGGSVATADETDNFTCRGRALAESLGALDALVNAAIHDAIDRANRRLECDAACLFDELRASVGADRRHPLTLVPHARLTHQILQQPGVERCRLRFGESIYGARPFNQPWLFPFTHRVIFLADSISLSGRVVGLDKINHFIREGLAHWRAVDMDGRSIDEILERELGGPGRSWRMTEHGLKGLGLTGVVSYADLAAGYSGFRFWRNLLSVDETTSHVGEDGGRYVLVRAFSFADYTNDAWDEAINCSAFDTKVGRHVTDALRVLGMSCPVIPCEALAALPDADLYVNPACLRRSADGRRTAYDGAVRRRMPIMRTAHIGGLSVALVFALAAALTAQNSNPRFGQWKLKSEAQPPQSNVMTYAPFGNGGMRVTIDSVNSRGEASQWGYTTMFDGKDEPVFGREGQTAAVRMITKRTAEITYKQNGRVSQVLTNVLSPDGNTIGIIYMRPGADGRPDSVSFATYERIR